MASDSLDEDRNGVLKKKMRGNLRLDAYGGIEECLKAGGGVRSH